MLRPGRTTAAAALAAAAAGGARRRRAARIVLAALVGIHVVALWLFALHAAQTRHIQLYLGAREAWSRGDLAAAARDFGAFAATYGDETAPFELRRNYPSAASAWFALGRIEAERGRVDAALAAFERAMGLEPGRGRREYRDLLLEHGRPAALATFARAELDRDPASAAAWWDLGAAWLALDRPAEAVAAYDRALRHLPALLVRRGVPAGGGLGPEEADLVNLRAVAKRLAGDVAGARADCAGVAARQAAGADLDRLCAAWLLAGDGRAAEAAERLRGYQPLGPEHEALLRRLAPLLPPPAGGGGRAPAPGAAPETSTASHSAAGSGTASQERAGERR